MFNKLSVVIPWKTDNGPREDIFLWVYNRYLSMPVGTIITSSAKSFTRASARNAGVNQVQSEYVLMADADTIPRREDIENAYYLLEGGKPWVICYADKKYYNLTEEKTQKILTMDSSVDVPEPVEGEYDHPMIVVAENNIKDKKDVFGMNLVPITEELRSKLNVKSNVNGIFVSSVERKSLAAKYGIKRGDIISAVNQRAITKVDEFYNIIEEAKKIKRKAVMIQIYRMGKIIFLNIPILDKQSDK